MARNITVAEKEIYEEIQRIIFYMIPEKWSDIKVYASINPVPIKGRRGELFFYYKPRKMLKTQYINCYEVPEIFDISDSEYLGLVSKLYNKILILNDYCITELGEFWSNITITIESGRFKIEKYNENLNTTEFDSYERHIAWRYKYLNISPQNLEEKRILKKYFKSAESKKEKTVYIMPMTDSNINNIIDYERVLSIEEAIAQTEVFEETEEQKGLIEKIKERNIKRAQENSGVFGNYSETLKVDDSNWFIIMIRNLKSDIKSFFEQRKARKLKSKIIKNRSNIKNTKNKRRKIKDKK